MTGDMDPKTNFALIVIQTELERYKFLVRSYLRARVAKVLLRLCRPSMALAPQIASFSRSTASP